MATKMQWEVLEEKDQIRGKAPTLVGGHGHWTTSAPRLGLRGHQRPQVIDRPVSEMVTLSTSAPSSSSFQSSQLSSLSTLDSSDVISTKEGQWVWSKITQAWEWVQRSEVNPTEAAVQDNEGWVQEPEGTYVRRIASWAP